MDGNYFRPKLQQARPFTGHGVWLDKPDFPEHHEDRRAEIQSYIRGRGWRVSDEITDVLSHCRKSSELVFVHELLQISGWVVQGERTLMNPRFLVRLSLGIFIDDIPIRILIEDLYRDKRFALIIESPRKYLPGIAAAMRRDLAMLARKVDQVWMCSDRDARSKGLGLRRDWNHALLRRMERHGIPDLGTETAAVRVQGSDLALDLSDLAQEEREHRLAGWLAAKEMSLESGSLRLLSTLERSEEILFALRMIRLPDVVPGDDYFQMGSLYRLYLGANIDGQYASVVLIPATQSAKQRKIAFQFSPGISSKLELRQHSERDDRIRQAGFEIIRVPVGQAKNMGSIWQRSIYDELAALKWGGSKL